jgi:hypothetical protein
LEPDYLLSVLNKESVLKDQLLQPLCLFLWEVLNEIADSKHAQSILDYALKKVGCLCVDKLYEDDYHVDYYEKNHKKYWTSVLLNINSKKSNLVKYLRIGELADTFLVEFQSLATDDLEKLTELLKSQMGIMIKVVLADKIDLSSKELLNVFFQRVEGELHSRFDQICGEYTKGVDIKPKLQVLAKSYSVLYRSLTTMAQKLILLGSSVPVEAFLDLQPSVGAFVTKYAECQEKIQKKIQIALLLYYDFSLFDMVKRNDGKGIC